MTFRSDCQWTQLLNLNNINLNKKQKQNFNLNNHYNDHQ